jgi:cell division protein FtsI (penicillin-binding protein 3)
VASNGKVKKQNVGLEKSYDSLLTGQKGQRLVRFIAGGVPVPVDGYQVEPENGKDIITTIDVNIQDIATTALMKKMMESEAQYGTAIVMEVKTGKIKAISNLGRQKDGSYFEDDNYALRVTEPGSTIKLATLLSVLEEGTSKPDDLVEVGTAGQMIVGPRIVNDAERSPKPVLSVKECFAHSSNVGMSKLAYKAFGQKPSRFKDYLKKYQFTERSPVDLSDMPKPRLTSFDLNAGGISNMLTMSFGYAIQISPLHTLTLYNAIANDGKMMKPYLVNRVMKDGLPYREFEPTVLTESICKPSTVKTAKESMEMVITEGTGRPAFKDMPFAVAGKTGTAHVWDSDIKYADMVYQASFVGYFPANDPVYSCIVVVRTRPHAALHYGGQLGAPVFREIATKLYAMYIENKVAPKFEAKKDSTAFFYAGSNNDIQNIFKTLSVNYSDSTRQATWTTVSSYNYYPVVKELAVSKGLMPDVRGLGFKDVVQIMESLGVKVRANGKGKVMVQSVKAGTALTKGMTVYVELG